MKDASWEEILSRLNEATETKSDAALAAALGLSHQAIYSAKSKGRIPPAWIYEAARRYDVSADWLFFGRGRKKVADPDESAAPSPTLEKAEVARRLLSTRQATPLDVEHDGIIECADCQIMMMPMVEARLSAGTGSFETGANIERRYAFRMDFLMRKGRPSQMVLMRVAGDSMEPYVMNGDVVLIDQSQCTPLPGKLYAVGVEEAVYLKTINTVPGKLVMTSYNTAYPPIEIDARGDLANGIRIIGRAVWVGRELN